MSVSIYNTTAERFSGIYISLILPLKCKTNSHFGPKPTFLKTDVGFHTALEKRFNTHLRRMSLHTLPIATVFYLNGSLIIKL